MCDWIFVLLGNWLTEPRIFLLLITDFWKRGHCSLLPLFGTHTIRITTSQVIWQSIHHSWYTDVPCCTVYLQGGSAVTNRAKRFDLVPATSPGPGAYNINTDWVKNTIYLAPSSAPPKMQRDKSCKGTVSWWIMFICCLFCIMKNSSRTIGWCCIGLWRILRIWKYPNLIN